MGNRKLTILIEGREALPIRAIPYVTSWQESPDSIVRSLAETATIKVGNNREIPNRHSLVAYGKDDRERYEPIPASQWKNLIVDINSLTTKLRTDERPNASDENHGPWRVAAVLKLPDDVFLWLDEFQSWYSTTRPMLYHDSDAARVSTLQAERERTDRNDQDLDDLEAEIFQTADDSLCMTPILPPEIEGKVWRYPDEDVAAEATSQVFPVATDSAIIDINAQPAITVNRIGTRTNILEAVIRQATERAAPPKDKQCVWVELVRLAESDSRPAPLLGFAEGEGVKYQDNSEVKFLTSKNLGDRMRRAKAR